MDHMVCWEFKLLRNFIADECGRCGLSFVWKAME